MMRRVYALLIRLHPPGFRQQFGEEMLWIFNEALPVYGTMRLLGDALISLTRQWILGEAIWKYPAAFIGAGVILWLGLIVPPRTAAGAFRAPVMQSNEAFYLMAALVSLLVISLTLTLSVLWFRFSRRRCA
jgi:hypothetical protein